MTAPKPTRMKLLEGTWRADRANAAEPQPSLGASPPPWLPSDGPARDAWDRLAGVLAEVRVLTVADAEALALGCVALEEFLAARGEHDGWRRADAAWKRYAGVLRDFGMTPAARTRVAAVPPPVNDPIADWQASAGSSPVSPPPTPARRRRKPVADADPIDRWMEGETS